MFFDGQEIVNQDRQADIGFGSREAAAGVAAELAVFFQVCETTLGDLAASFQNRFGGGGQHLCAVSEDHVFVFAAAKLAAVAAGRAGGTQHARGTHR